MGPSKSEIPSLFLFYRIHVCMKKQQFSNPLPLLFPSPTRRGVLVVSKGVDLYFQEIEKLHVFH